MLLARPQQAVADQQIVRLANLYHPFHRVESLN
jgi:hypothetical protein